MNGILIATLSMGALGILFGAALSFIGKKFAIPEDPLKDSIREALPGANCGGCGYAGCDAYAEAVAKGIAKGNLCPVGGESVVEALNQLTGSDEVAPDRVVATVMCRGDVSRCGVRFEYDGPRDCRSASLVAQGDKACTYSCLGLGNCEKICPLGAITVNENRLAEVDETKCHGCGACVSECPRNVLQLLPVKHPVHRTCSAMERGKVVMDHCTAGCVGCGKCARSCKFDAIVMVKDLPQIDLGKCVGCMRCADSCPTGALKSNESLRRQAVIDLSHCDGCDECKKACHFDAIVKNEEKKNVVVAWNCTGCGACVGVCPTHCIHMGPGTKYER